MLPTLPELNPQNYLNRELSAIEFNRRVLYLARDANVPLLERVRFISIVASNLDEFFMVRVSAYVKKARAGVTGIRPDGYNPTQLLFGIRERVTSLLEEMRQVMHTLLTELRQEGIYLLGWNEVGPSDRTALSAYFEREIFPLLTPWADDPARPFPFISNLSLNIGVYLTQRGQRHDFENLEFARIKIPEQLSRLVDLHYVRSEYGGDSDGIQNPFVWVEDVIADNLETLFPGMEIVEQHPFRVTRNADIDYEHELEDEDYAEFIEKQMRERRFGDAVRLTVQDTISDLMMTHLTRELEVDPKRDVYVVEGALGASSLAEIADLERPELKYTRYVPRVPEELSSAPDIFTAIRQNDFLVHMPYDSFGSVEQFLATAAHDPDVVTIKATLYRVGKNSPLVRSLMAARDNDKQVAVLVELKARFDEENNLEWARALEDAGVHVTYGVERLAIKTHAKVCLVIRKEGRALRSYVHLGTGNYNAGTARFYGDVGLFTCDPIIGDDAMRLFNRLTGFAPATTYKRLLVAPEYLHQGIVDLIDGETRAALAGKPARIIMKMNQLEEDLVIQHMYRASQAGVQIDLSIRGICCLAPGIPGISENIRVRAILGRYLEHARIIYFQNALPDQRVWFGSADMMRRNLYNRVEVVAPVVDPRLQKKMLRLLATDLMNTDSAWELGPDGLYRKIEPAPGEEPINSQSVFMLDSFGLDIEP